LKTAEKNNEKSNDKSVSKETKNSMTSKEFSKAVSDLKSGHEKELKELSTKYDSQIKELEKYRPEGKENEKLEDKNIASKNEQIEQKQESRGR